MTRVRFFLYTSIAVFGYVVLQKTCQIGILLVCNETMFL